MVEERGQCSKSIRPYSKYIMRKDIQDHREIASMGGKKIAEKIGSEGMAALARKGRESIKKKDPEYGKKLSQAGVHAREVKKQQWIKENINESAADRLSKAIFGS